MAIVCLDTHETRRPIRNDGWGGLSETGSHTKRRSGMFQARSQVRESSWAFYPFKAMGRRFSRSPGLDCVVMVWVQPKTRLYTQWRLIVFRGTLSPISLIDQRALPVEHHTSSGASASCSLDNRSEGPKATGRRVGKYLGLRH